MEDGRRRGVEAQRRRIGEARRPEARRDGRVPSRVRASSCAPIGDFAMLSDFVRTEFGGGSGGSRHPPPKPHRINGVHAITRRTQGFDYGYGSNGGDPACLDPRADGRRRTTAEYRGANSCSLSGRKGRHSGSDGYGRKGHAHGSSNVSPTRYGTRRCPSSIGTCTPSSLDRALERGAYATRSTLAFIGGWCISSSGRITS